MHEHPRSDLIDCSCHGQSLLVVIRGTDQSQSGEHVGNAVYDADEKKERDRLEASLVEPVRLVIWDLDETFWGGTLTEGGIAYNRAMHDIVIELARRGIVSSICSKNDIEPVRVILQREGIWDYFVFPSVNWEPKGQRLAALVEAVQLRPSTIMFIDDNPMNLAEAQHYVPGIQIRGEYFIAEMLEHPLFKGKDDRELKRLAQYQLLQHRQTEERSFGADNTEFLRASGLRVTIEHDLDLHLDRAVELINRTNQLNFTKQRLPEDPAEARTALRRLLNGYDIQAGIVRVRDRYGDYGHAGIYVMKTGGGWKKLVHFCFSCRILNMGVETWLYNRLGQPPLRVVGDVLTDVARDKRQIDWISLDNGAEQSSASDAAMIDVFYARGGCDLLAISHYFSLIAKKIIGEYNFVRNGANLRLEHSMFARYGILGTTKEARQALVLFGFRQEDFTSQVPDLGDEASGVWLLSFWSDADYALYRHRQTGVMAPLSLPDGVLTNMRNLITTDDAISGAEPAFLKALRGDFEYVGLIPEDEFKANLRLIVANAPRNTRVFILQMNEALPRANRTVAIALNRQKVNRWVEAVAAESSKIELLKITDFVVKEEELISPSHFDRMVYFRIYRHIVQAIGEAVGVQAPRPAAATNQRM